MPFGYGRKGTRRLMVKAVGTSGCSCNGELTFTFANESDLAHCRQDRWATPDWRDVAVTAPALALHVMRAANDMIASSKSVQLNTAQPEAEWLGTMMDSHVCNAGGRVGPRRVRRVRRALRLPLAAARTVASEGGS